MFKQDARRVYAESSLLYNGEEEPPLPLTPPPSIRHLKVLAQKAMTVVCSVILWKHAASGQICGSRVETGNKDEKIMVSVD